MAENVERAPSEYSTEELFAIVAVDCEWAADELRDRLAHAEFEQDSILHRWLTLMGVDSFAAGQEKWTDLLKQRDELQAANTREVMIRREFEALRPIALSRIADLEAQLANVLHSSFCTKCGWRGRPEVAIPIGKAWACGNPECGYQVPEPKAAIIERLTEEVARLKSDLRDLQLLHAVRTASREDNGDAKCAAVLVPIPDHVWPGIVEFKADHPEYGLDAENRKCLALDACVVDAVKALWAAGIVTRSCCCGHGNGWGLVTILPKCGEATA